VVERRKTRNQVMPRTTRLAGSEGTGASLIESLAQGAR
jgi:hypothetical protein